MDGDAIGNAANAATVKNSNSAQVSIFLFTGSALVLNSCSSAYMNDKISTRTMYLVICMRFSALLGYLMSHPFTLIPLFFVWLITMLLQVEVSRLQLVLNENIGLTHVYSAHNV